MAESPLVVGLDMSEGSVAALAAALRLAAELGRDVTVVHAVGLLEEGGQQPLPGPRVCRAKAGADRAEFCEVTDRFCDGK